MSTFSRRTFLTLTLGAGGLAAAGLAADLKSTPSQAEVQTFTRTSWALGSDVALTVLHGDKEAAERALNAAFVELAAIEDVLSVYRPNSEISRLNRAGKLERPHAHFVRVLEAALSMSQASNGAFDPTVQPLWELYAAAKKRNVLPSAIDIERARAQVNYRAVTCHATCIAFTVPATKLTLNGIAQGYAADRVLQVLTAHGIEHALVDTGEMTSKGRKADGSPFRVGIQHPRKPDDFIGVCSMDGRALATSGDYATTFSDDFLYHHIFDPATGRSPLELSSASILAPTGMQADALTKPVFILGAEKGLALVESLPDCDAFLVTKDGRTFKTKGFPLT